jgi:hypothetical protein
MNFSLGCGGKLMHVVDKMGELHSITSFSNDHAVYIHPEEIDA